MDDTSYDGAEHRTDLLHSSAAEHIDEAKKEAIKRWYTEQVKSKPKPDDVRQPLTIVERAQALAAKALTREREEKPGKLVYLPTWPDAMRGMPNVIARSALFGIIQRGKRKYVEGQKIAIPAVTGVTILHTGPQLDQNDLDVWLQCLHLTRNQAIGTPIRFTSCAFLRSIGRNTGKRDYEWLQGVFRRLMSSVIEIECMRKGFAGQLIRDWYRDETTGENVIILNPKIAALFADDAWTAEQWSERMALKGHQLARWLHTFYSTHAAPLPYKVETIRQLSGSSDLALYSFRRELRKALAKVVDVTGWSWFIDEDDLVHITKTPTASQQRHLIRRRGRPRKPR